MTKAAVKTIATLLLIFGMTAEPGVAAGIPWIDALIAAPPPDRGGWAGSRTCRTCHRDHHRTWHRTYHRTMTQEATDQAVVAPFDGRVLDYWGQQVRPVRDGDEFYLEYLDRTSGQAFKRLPVERTVGSHRYQQYLTRHPDAGPGNFWRLPLLWHMEADRWIHVNAVFLGSDDQHFDSHLTMWNQNCIFCHNTGPRPGIQNMPELMAKGRRGEPVDFRYEPRYRSRVAELGIACEACHSPGETHAEANRNPIRRYALHLTGQADPTIVNPTRLDHRRSAAICGQCHAQRVPAERAMIRQWLETGPTFRAGDLLEDHVEPIRQDTPPADPTKPDQFRLRFWMDGTPRLSAYEYQGLTMSACFSEGQATCITCHSGHEGSPAGMITEVNRSTNEPCLACHESIGENVQAHTRHEPEGPGSLCYDCHMPRLAYGVMTIHRSHHIEIPAPAANRAGARPDACTNCHVDRSVAWAQQAMAELWPDVPAVDGLPTMPRLVLDLLTGDPVQRAIAARLAGETDHPDASRQFLVPFLLLTLEDRYPMLRWFAQHSLRKIAPGLTAGLEDWDFIAPREERAELIGILEQRWAATDKTGLDVPDGLPLDANLVPVEERVAALTALRANKEIEIGE